VRDLLWVLFFQRNNVSAQWARTASVSVSPVSDFKWKTPMFIPSGLWLQHQDLNPMDYKIFVEFSIGSVSAKFRTWTNRHYGMAGVALSNGSLTMLQTSGVNVSCKRMTFLVFSLTADYTFMHFNVLLWWKLHVSRCCCVEYIRISPKVKEFFENRPIFDKVMNK